MLTVDANVFVSASAPADVFHGDSNTFLSRVRRTQISVSCPSLLLPETASGIMRPSGNALAAQAAVATIQTFPGLHLFPLTEQRAEQAAQIALNYGLRGADAVYVAMAQELGTTLITWDNEMLTRTTAVVIAMTPADWLAANPTI